MFGYFRTENRAASDITDGLVPQTHPKNWDIERCPVLGDQGLPNHINTNAALFWRARTGRKKDALRSKFGNLLDRDLVIPVNHDITTALADVLDQIVGERVVIIDHENHWLGIPESSEDAEAEATITRLA